MHDKMPAIFMLVIGALVLNYYWHERKTINDKVAKIKGALKKFAQRDQLWDETLLIKVASDTFEAYYNAMDTFHDGEFDVTGPPFNFQQIKHMVHPKATWEVKGGNRNRFSFNSVLAQKKMKVEISIIHARNSSNDDKDCFTACIKSLNVQLVSHTHGFNNQHTRMSKNYGNEFWTFQRLGNKWLLLCIHDESNWEMFTNMRILDEGQNETKS